MLKKMVMVGMMLGAMGLPVVAGAVISPEPAVAFAPETAGAEDDASYSAGTHAMNEQKWADAIVAFDKVIAAKGKRVAAAMYWKAYCLDKLGKTAESSAVCETLKEQYDSSSWNRECFALKVRHGFDAKAFAGFGKMEGMEGFGDGWDFGEGFGRGRSETRDPEAEMKLLALNSVMRQEPGKAIPILRGILASDQKESLKKQALFVLMQSKTPDAQAVVNEIALGKLAPTMQRQAVQMMGVFQGPKGNETLAEVYRTTSDVKLKKAVISSFFITHDAARMVEIARGEKDLQLKREIVSQLALMRDKVATDYMMELLK